MQLMFDAVPVTNLMHMKVLSMRYSNWKSIMFSQGNLSMRGCGTYVERAERFGGTYTCWSAKQRFTSIYYRRLGNEPVCNRKRVNDVFTSFLSNLTFPNVNKLHI